MSDSNPSKPNELGSNPTASGAPATSAPEHSQHVVADVNPRRWIILSIIVLGLLIVVLDNTVLNVALPSIQRDLNATQSQLIWAINAYTLTFAALLFTWGVLGDRYGRKKMLMVGLTLFMLASALCAWAQTPNQLVAFRALLGIGGAAVLPISLAIITVVFPPNERGKAIGIWAAAVGGAVAIGPVLGGFLLEHFWWGSVFLINVPVVAGALIGIWLVVPESMNPKPGRLDPLGLLLSIVGLTAMVYGIMKGGDDHDWAQWLVWIPIIAGLGMLILFVVIESRSDHPSLDLTLFKIRSYSTPLATVTLVFAAMSGSLLFLSFYMQEVRDWSPLKAGLYTLPVAVGQLIAAPNSNRMVARFGARRWAPLGLGLVIIVYSGLTFIKQDTPNWLLVLAFFSLGLGLGSVIAPMTTRMTLATPPLRSGAGSAAQNTVRQVGAVFGVAIISSVVATVYSNKMTPLLTGKGLPPEALHAATGSIGGTREVVLQAKSAGKIDAAQALAVTQAAKSSFMVSFHVATALSAGLVLLALLILLWRLPAKAEAVAWAAHTGSGPAEEPTLDKLESNASTQIVDVDDRALAHGDVDVEVDGVIETRAHDGTQP
jgi:EmrB/QacA subfamily drug resistance transporter